MDLHFPLVFVVGSDEFDPVGYEGTYLKGGEVWVVMENMPCGSLADLIEAHDVCPMREREIAFATKQLLMVRLGFILSH